MRKIILTSFFFAVCLGLDGQNADTTIYQVAEEMPRFPGCEQLDTTIQAKQQCAQQQLLAFMYENIRYPLKAIEENLEGTVVVTFVVEKDGSISSPRVLKDIGGGCGLEALRVVGVINQSEIRFIPGKQAGKVARVQYNVPIRFKLQDPLPYVLIDRDTVYTQFDKQLEFNGGAENLAKFLDDRLSYPDSGNEGCLVGNMQVQVLVESTGDVRILDIVDYSDLGFDFWYSAIDACTSTMGQWTPAQYKSRNVPSAIDVSLSFTPTAEGCKTVVSNFEKANQLAREGAQFLADGKQEEGIAKLSEAVSLFPNDANLLLNRGQAYLDMNKFTEACADLSLARSISLVNWYDTILPLICAQGAKTGQ